MEQTQRPLVKPLIKYPEGQRPKEVVLPPRKSPEEKKYYLLINYKNDTHDPTWRECFGRTEAIQEGRFYAMDQADLERSVVFVEGVAVDPNVSLYWFLKQMENLSPDPTFEVDDYWMDIQEQGTSNGNIDIPEQVSSFMDIENDEDRDV